MNMSDVFVNQTWYVTKENGVYYIRDKNMKFVIFLNNEHDANAVVLAHNKSLIAMMKEYGHQVFGENKKIRDEINEC